MQSLGNGYAPNHCSYHVQFKARHGSHWHPTYRAASLKPYLKAASAWINPRRSEGTVAATLLKLGDLMRYAGPIDPAMNLRGVPAATRARVAFARLREADIKAERLLAIQLSVSALIEDDAGSHRVWEFRIVQVAKAVHRLASGTHRRWQMPSAQGRPVPIELHVYPKSSGVVLRRMGMAIEKACEFLPVDAANEIIALKAQRFGPHPSHLPGWRPTWDKSSR